MTSKVTFTAATPMLPTGSASLREAVDFYRDQLGFEVLWQSGTMAGVRRGAVAFHLVVNTTQAWLDNASVSVGVDNLDALYEEYRHLPARLGPLEMKAWGRREFHMILPHGVCLQFYQDPS